MPSPRLGLMALLSLTSFTVAQAQVKVSVDETTPVVPLSGRASATVAAREKDLLPGQIADVAYGDTTLENDYFRVVIAKPGKKTVNVAGGGNIIDVVHKKFQVDYLDYIRQTADLQSSQGLVRYSGEIRTTGAPGTTITASVSGEGRAPVEDAPNQLSTLSVATDYTIAPNDPTIKLTTTYTNNSTQTVSFVPGDIIDWGLLTPFLEGRGVISDYAVQPARFVAGFADDFSLGLVGEKGQALEGLHTSRVSLVQYVGKAELPKSLRAPKPPVEQENRTGVKPTPTPEPIVTPKLLLPPSGGMLTPRSSETRYGLIFDYSRVETPYNPAAVKPTAAPTPATTPKPTPGPQSSLMRAFDADVPGGGDAPTPANRGTLKPGQSFTVVRYLIVSDRDMSRILNKALKLSSEKSGYVAGAVYEAKSDDLIAGADILVSGGPQWNGEGTAPPYVRGSSRSDGTFGIRLPLGRYQVIAMKNGRMPVGDPIRADLSTTSPQNMNALVISKPSTVKIVVTDGAGQAVPARVSLTAKPGTPAANFGMGASGVNGQRNVFYVPTGSGTFEISPGRYIMTVSRGVEYDIVRGDLTVAPNAAQSVNIALTHSLKDQLKGMISFDAGIMTNASSAGTADAETRAVQAACEGVPVIITGDYGQATDLTPAIKKLKLEGQVKSIPGRRWLLSKDGTTMDLFAFPISGDVETSMAAMIEKDRDTLSPDVLLSDLRAAFPKVFFEIDRPMDPDKGYLKPFAFSERHFSFANGNLPPADFDGLQITEGKRAGVQSLTVPRYFDLLIERFNAGQSYLTAFGSSNSRVAFSEEIGYPRTYIYTQRDTLDRIDGDTIASALRSGRYLVTNGPIVLLSALDPKTGLFSARPGDVVDCHTTQTVVARLNVVAAPWVALNGISLNLNGQVQDKTEVMPTTRIVRYPVQADPNSANRTRYLDGDAVMDATCFSSTRSLAPVVEPAPQFLGGEVLPYCWTGPILVDANGDGKITPKRRERE